MLIEAFFTSMGRQQPPELLMLIFPKVTNDLGAFFKR